jgi:hypothetical protein
MEKNENSKQQKNQQDNLRILEISRYIIIFWGFQARGLLKITTTRVLGIFARKKRKNEH